LILKENKKIIKELNDKCKKLNDYEEIKKEI